MCICVLYIYLFKDQFGKEINGETEYLHESNVTILKIIIRVKVHVLEQKPVHKTSLSQTFASSK